ncbi:MAG TPA: magnesium/cobalt transporter CorA [Candidatus Heimdallarchaeota archaeon]|nr:magnesium/cobalt transporter CorA [Candidatus Heimdallarchaeota archaeon]
MFKIDKFIKKRKEKIGSPPGTPVYTGEKKEEAARVTVIDYDEEHFQEKEISHVDECFGLKDSPSVSWINVDGIHDGEVINAFSENFGLHPLVVEDILHTGQRPKIEDYGEYIFIVFTMLQYDEERRDIIGEQVSLILSDHFVLSFQERPGDIFDLIRERIRNGKGRIRKMGTDYLAYSLVDAVVDHYFVILEKTGERIEELEESLTTNAKPETMQEIHRLKREMLYLRKSIWPLRESISGLEKSESVLIKKSTLKYLRDVYDHTIQIIDTVETFRDMLSGMHDIYLSSISNRMNEIMKVLTIIATIFIPLTFVAGIYGMNFKFMPELDWRWGYPALWLVVVTIVVIMIIFFKRKKWL